MSDLIKKKLKKTANSLSFQSGVIDREEHVRARDTHLMATCSPQLSILAIGPLHYLVTWSKLDGKWRSGT